MIDNIGNKDLYELDKAFTKMMNKFPDKRVRLVRSAADKMYAKVLSNINRDVKRKKGNLIRGVRQVIGSNGRYAAVKPNWYIASHTHLVENGHRIVTGKNPSKSAKKYRGEVDTRKDTGKWVSGKHMYRNALNELADELVNDAEKMIDELVGDIFG